MVMWRQTARATTAAARDTAATVMRMRRTRGGGTRGHGVLIGTDRKNRRARGAAVRLVRPERALGAKKVGDVSEDVRSSPSAGKVGEAEPERDRRVRRRGRPSWRRRKRRAFIALRTARDVDASEEKVDAWGDAGDGRRDPVAGGRRCGRRRGRGRGRARRDRRRAGQAGTRASRCRPAERSSVGSPKTRRRLREGSSDSRTTVSIGLLAVEDFGEQLLRIGGELHGEPTISIYRSRRLSLRSGRLRSSDRR